jgi:hypothetical protein
LHEGSIVTAWERKSKLAAAESIRMELDRGQFASHPEYRKRLEAAEARLLELLAATT